MARRTGEGLNELRLHDNISDSDIVLYYRPPTTEEQTAYTNGITARRRNRVVTRLGETRMKYGGRILTGFRPGDFEKKQGDGWVPYASDPQDPAYDPEWLKLVCTYASDLVELLAVHAFEASASVDVADEDEPGEEETGEDPRTP